MSSRWNSVVVQAKVPGLNGVTQTMVVGSEAPNASKSEKMACRTQDTPKAITPIWRPPGMKARTEVTQAMFDAKHNT
jgi:hypothetical protein